MKKVDFIILALLCIFIFSDTVRIPFMWDDIYEVERNPLIRNAKISNFFSLSYWRGYRTKKSSVDIPLKPVSPIRTLSLILDYKIFGIRPWGYHLVNLFLHIVNVFLVYILVFALFNDRWLSFMSAVLFASHPIHLETVCWIKNRIDLFTSIFFITSLLFFVYWDKSSRKIYYTLSLILFAFGLLSKETNIVLPLVLVFYLLCFREKISMKDLILKTLPFWFLTFIFLLFQKFVVQADKVAVMTAQRFKYIWQHVYVVIETIGYYFYLLFLPLRFSPERYLPVRENIFEPMVFVSFIVILLYFILVVYLFKTNRKLSFIVALLLIPLLPVSNIIYLVTRPISEHRLYLPSVAFCVIVAYLLNRIKILNPKFRNAVVVSLMILLTSIYSFATMRRIYDWRSQSAFWESAEKNSLPNSRIYINLGVSYLWENKIEEALEKFKLAEELTPDDPYLLNALGTAYISMNKYEEAVRVLTKAIMFYPTFEYAWANLGWAYYNIGQREKAISACEFAKKINPTLALAYIQLAQIYKREGKIKEAEIEFKKSLELEYYPWELHKELIDMYENNKMFDKAITEYKKAIDVDPTNVWAYNGLGIVFAQIGEYEAAKECFEKALEIEPTNRIIRKNKGEIERFLLNLKSK